MYKIRIYKMIIYTVLTLGLYLLYWFWRTRNDLVKIYNQDVPSFFHLIAISAGLLAVAFAGAFLLNNGILGGAIFAAGFIGAFAYVLFWMWRYSVAAEVATEGKANRWLLFVLVIFADDFMPFVAQYYFNRIPDAQSSKLQQL